jgi:hypothetical protein
MSSITHKAASAEGAQTGTAEVSLTRLYVLRASYLLLVIGLGAMTLPELLSHPLITRGVIPSLLGGVWVLAFLGLRYPLQMLPLLLFEFAWKTIWFFDYGLPQWRAGYITSQFTEDLTAIGVGVILMPLVIPWGYVVRHYFMQPGERWSGSAPRSSRSPKVA